MPEEQLLQQAIESAKENAGTKPEQPDEPQPAAEPVKNDDSSLRDMESRYLAAQNDMQQRLWEERQRARAAEEKAKSLEGKSFSDPYEAFKKLGGSFDELAEREVNEGKPSTEHILAEMQRRLDQEVQWRKEKEAKEQKDTIENQRSQAVQAAAGDMLRTIRTDTDRYSEVGALIDFVQEMSGADPQTFIASKVNPIMEDFYSKTGKQLTPDELLGNLHQEATGFLEKMRNSGLVKMLLSQPTDLEAKETQPSITEPLRTPTQQESTSPGVPENLSEMSNARFYQLVDGLKNK